MILDRQLLTAWMDRRQFAPATCKTYGSVIEALAVWLAGCERGFNDCDPKLLLSFFQSRDVSSSTQKRYLKFLADFFDFLVEEGAITKNRIRQQLLQERIPRKAYGSDVATGTLPIFLSDKEISQLCNSFPSSPEDIGDIRRKALILFLLGCGPRNAEAANIEWKDLDLSLNHPQARLVSHGGLERLVPVPREAADALRHLKQVIGSPQQAAAGLTGKVFVKGRSKAHYTPSGLWRLVHSALTRAGIVKPTLSPHVLRNSYAVHQLAQGMDLATLKQRMGHKKITTTAVYVRVKAIR